MGKYRKRPVVVDAKQFLGNPQAMISWSVSKGAAEAEVYTDLVGNLYIHHIWNGDVKVNIGEYLIKGERGEFYPCAPDIFHATYEEVEEGVESEAGSTS